MSSSDKYYERLKGKYKKPEETEGEGSKTVGEVKGALPDDGVPVSVQSKSYLNLGSLDYICPVCNEKRSITLTLEEASKVKKHYQDQSFNGNPITYLDPHEGRVKGKDGEHHQVEVSINEDLSIGWSRAFDSSMLVGVNHQGSSATPRKGR